MPKETSASEKRGPITKTKSGWPLNPYGALAAVIIFLAAFLLLFFALKKEAKPSPKPQPPNTKFAYDTTPPSGKIIEPKAGLVVKDKKLKIIAQAEDGESGVAAVEFWVSDYLEKSWARIARLEKPPFEYEWDISNQGDKAIILTMHIYDLAGNLTRDPDGWHEGIVLIPSWPIKKP